MTPIIIKLKVNILIIRNKMTNNLIKIRVGDIVNNFNNGEGGSAWVTGNATTLADVFSADAWARARAETLVDEYRREGGR